MEYTVNSLPPCGEPLTAFKAGDVVVTLISNIVGIKTKEGGIFWVGDGGYTSPGALATTQRRYYRPASVRLDVTV
jgi:hypothetical protein